MNEFDTVEESIAMNNGVTQGLSSAIFTDSMSASERFLSPAGSDCGIANVNIGQGQAKTFTYPLLIGPYHNLYKSDWIVETPDTTSPIRVSP